MKMDAEKRFSPMKYTKSINQRRGAYSPFKKNQQRLHSTKYFCHFSNGMYMGGADCFKKSGQGIMLLDDGSCVLCTHSHDNMVGHNVVFRNKSMTSLLIDMARNKNVCFRMNQYLLQFSTTSRDEIEGPGYFIDYNSKKIFKLTYKHSKLQRKLKITDQKILKKVFEERDATGLIHVDHARALDFDFDIVPEIKYITNDTDHAFGFCEKQKGKRGLQPNGLSFRMRVSQKAEFFDIQIEERGYFQKNYMQHFGERLFSNGNLYVGGFNQGEFEGYGVLYDSVAKKWTYGIYHNGDLIQILDSSVKNKKRSFQDVTREIHKTDKTFIQSKVLIKPTIQTLYDKIDEIFKMDPFQHDSQDHATLERLKNQCLKRIQYDYTNRHYERQTQQAILNVIHEGRTRSASKEKELNIPKKQPPTSKYRTLLLQQDSSSSSKINLNKKQAKKNNKSTSNHSKKNVSPIKTGQQQEQYNQNHNHNSSKRVISTTPRAPNRYYYQNNDNKQHPETPNHLITEFYTSNIELEHPRKYSPAPRPIYDEYRFSANPYEEIYQRSRMIERIKLERQLQHIENLQKQLHKEEIERINLNNERTTPSYTENSRYAIPDVPGHVPKTNNIAYYPEEHRTQRSRSKESSGSIRRRPAQYQYQYQYPADSINEGQLFDRLTGNRYYQHHHQPEENY